jgi:hypothetical protein
MRSFLFAALAIVVFAVTMIGETSDAYAVVCARGVVRAGGDQTRIDQTRVQFRFRGFCADMLNDLRHSSA